MSLSATEPHQVVFIQVKGLARPREVAMVALVWLVGIVILGVAALIWGEDSTEQPDSLEWMRRRDWWV